MVEQAIQELVHTDEQKLSFFPRGKSHTGCSRGRTFGACSGGVLKVWKVLGPKGVVYSFDCGWKGAKEQGRPGVLEGHGQVFFEGPF